MLETDIECNSYNRKIGANNKLKKSKWEKNWKDKLMNSLINKHYTFIKYFLTHKLNIINSEQKMRLIHFMIMKSYMKLRKLKNKQCMICGQLKRNMRLSLLLIMISWLKIKQLKQVCWLLMDIEWNHITLKVWTNNKLMQ